MIEAGFCASTGVHRLKGQALCLSLADCTKGAPAFLGTPCLQAPARHDTGTASARDGATAPIFFELPELLRGLPFADKIAAGAAFEEHRPGPWIWVDEETIFLRQPTLPDEAPLAVNPVDLRNIGEPPGSEPGPFWRILMDWFGLEGELPHVRTTVTDEPVRGYYNAGMLFVGDNRQVFRTALEAMTALMASPAFRRVLDSDPRFPVFFHQAALSCAIELRYAGEIRRLPEGWNLPYHLRASFSKPPDFLQAVSLRYDDDFDGLLPGIPDGSAFLTRIRETLVRETGIPKEGL